MEAGKRSIKTGNIDKYQKDIALREGKGGA